MQQFDSPPRASWLPLVEAALAEDVGPGDATTLALIAPQARGSARLEARQPLVVCGSEIAREVFARFGVELSIELPDGSAAEPGAILAQAHGPARGILTAERVEGGEGWGAHLTPNVGFRLVRKRRSAPGGA